MKSVAIAIAAVISSTAIAGEIKGAKVYACREQSAPLAYKSNVREAGEFSPRGMANIVDLGDRFIALKTDFSLSFESGKLPNVANDNHMQSAPMKDGAYMARGVGPSKGTYTYRNEEYAMIWSCN